MSASPTNFRHNMPLSPIEPISWYRVFYPVMIVVLLGVLVFSLAYYLNDPVRFPIKRVEIGGKVVFTDKSNLMRVIKKHSGKGFFGLNIEAVKNEVASLPWIRMVSVRRVLPNRVYIEVKERVATMQWNDNALIGESGEVYYPSQLRLDNGQLGQWRSRFSHLPHLRGDDERSQHLQGAFSRYNKSLNQLLPKLLGLYEDDRRSQTLLLSENIIVRLGYEQLDERLTRFINVFPKYVVSESATGVQFDMRYTNGFTVVNFDGNSNSTTGSN